MVSKGDKIDLSFTIKAVQGGEEQETSFAGLLDRRSVVSVYMKNNTGSCDKQNKSLAAHANEFDKLGYNLIAISKDGGKSHMNYAGKLGINYTLVSDPENLFSKATDSVVEKKMYGKTYEGPSRSAFIIDTDGTVLDLIEKITPASHAEELLDRIKQL
ncbi:MAG: redoxin domain-containing protein [Balneolales bacterium]|nr:redoxin domain-containing protein [Balneolales bacterium]